MLKTAKKLQSPAKCGHFSHQPLISEFIFYDFIFLDFISSREVVKNCKIFIGFCENLRKITET